MSGTIYTSISSGDWNTAAIWSTDAVPDSSTADVTIDTSVTIGSSESFAVGSVDIGSLDTLEVDGGLGTTSMDVGAQSTFQVSGDVGIAGVLTVETGGLLDGIGIGTITGSIDNSGLIFESAGLLDLAGQVSGNGSIEINNGAFSAAALELGQGSNEDVTFTGPGGLLGRFNSALILDDPGCLHRYDS